MIGTIISHYKILEKIGEGGMGIVFKALDTKLERTVALKILRPETLSDPDAKARFIREAKAASAIDYTLTFVLGTRSGHNKPVVARRFEVQITRLELEGRLSRRCSRTFLILGNEAKVGFAFGDPAVFVEQTVARLRIDPTATGHKTAFGIIHHEVGANLTTLVAGDVECRHAGVVDSGIGESQ